MQPSIRLVPEFGSSRIEALEVTTHDARYAAGMSTPLISVYGQAAASIGLPELASDSLHNPISNPKELDGRRCVEALLGPLGRGIVLFISLSHASPILIGAFGLHQ
jgi:hypothetical protein